jgi:predicted DNA-binding protein with PD1-like motif
MMKTRMKLIVLFLMTAGVLFAQQTRRTRVNASPNPADDTKPNSDKVPEAYSITSHFDRIVVLRLKYKTYLLAGLEKMVKQEHIRNGVILAGAGSLRGYEIHQVSNNTFPPHDTFEKNPNAPADLLSMNGYVINGRVHAHITLATPDKAIGGHLEPGTQVFTFAIVTIGVMNEADLSRVDDFSYR